MSDPLYSNSYLHLENTFTLKKSAFVDLLMEQPGN